MSASNEAMGRPAESARHPLGRRSGAPSSSEAASGPSDQGLNARGRSVLVLGNYRATLVVIRSMAAAGFRVVLGVSGNVLGNDRSRHVAELWHHPPFDAGSQAFGGALTDLLSQRPDIQLVFPVTEEAVVHFARGSFDLPHGVSVAGASPEIVDVCQSKEKTLVAASSSGVPSARYAVVNDLHGLLQAADDIGFPCIVRPLVAPSRIFGRKALILKSQADLHSSIPHWPTEHARLLVQRYLRAPRHNLYFVAVGGQVERCVHVLIRRTDRADGTGLAVEGDTIELDPRLHGYTQRLVAQLSYTGVGCAQFLVDPDSGEISFIEMNPRLGANSAIVQASGLDLPLCAAVLALGLPLSAARQPTKYRVGLRYAWLFGDLAGLLSEARGGRVGPRAALGWLGELAGNSMAADVHLTFSRRDPMPTLALFTRKALRRSGEARLRSDSSSAPTTDRGRA